MTTLSALLADIARTPEPLPSSMEGRLLLGAVLVSVGAVVLVLRARRRR